MLVCLSVLEEDQKEVFSLQSLFSLSSAFVSKQNHCLRPFTSPQTRSVHLAFALSTTTVQSTSLCFNLGYSQFIDY